MAGTPSRRNMYIIIAAVVGAILLAIFGWGIYTFFFGKSSDDKNESESSTKTKNKDEKATEGSSEVSGKTPIENYEISYESEEEATEEPFYNDKIEILEDENRVENLKSPHQFSAELLKDLKERAERNTIPDTVAEIYTPKDQDFEGFEKAFPFLKQIVSMINSHESVKPKNFEKERNDL